MNPTGNYKRTTSSKRHLHAPHLPYDPAMPYLRRCCQLIRSRITSRYQPSLAHGHVRCIAPQAKKLENCLFLWVIHVEWEVVAKIPFEHEQKNPIFCEQKNTKPRPIMAGYDMLKETLAPTLHVRLQRFDCLGSQTTLSPG